MRTRGIQLRQWGRWLRATPAWRFGAGTSRRFRADEGALRAAALAYRTLLTLVPLLAVVLALLKGAGFSMALGPFLLDQLPMLEADSVAALLEYIDRANARSIGGIGLAGLLLAAWSMLGEVERALNLVFGVAKTRGIARRISEYLSMLTLGTAVVALSISAQTLLTQPQFLYRVMGAAVGSTAEHLGLFLLPWASSWVGFTMLYAWVPNITLPWRWTVSGAFVASCCFQLVQIVFLEIQFAFAGYHAIYGALAQLPILLIWVYASWLVVLLGAEGVATAVTYWGDAGPIGAEGSGRPASHPAGAALSFELLRRVLERFESGGRPLRATDLAAALDLSAREVAAALRPWIQADVLRYTGGEQQLLFARSPRQLDLAQLHALLAVPQARIGAAEAAPESAADSG